MSLRHTASALALAAALVAPAGAHAYQLKRDPSGAVVRFEGEEVTFRLPPTIPAGMTRTEVDAAITAALKSWADAAGLTLKLVPGVAGAEPGYVSGRQNYNDILFIESSWSWDDRAIATTLLKLDPLLHTIVDADIVINADQHDFRVLPDTSKPGGIYDDLQSAMAHEIGHALGMDHSALDTATMYPEALNGEINKRTLEQDDVDGINALYGSGVVDPNVTDPGKDLQNSAKGMAALNCGTAGAPLPAAALLALVGLLRRRRAAT